MLLIVMEWKESRVWQLPVALNRGTLECVMHVDGRCVLWRAAGLQGYEVWQALGGWVSEAKPNLGPGISERFKMASGITQQEYAAAIAKRQRWVRTGAISEDVGSSMGCWDAAQVSLAASAAGLDSIEWSGLLLPLNLCPSRTC